jgi:hypothetical protein
MVLLWIQTRAYIPHTLTLTTQAHLTATKPIITRHLASLNYKAKTSFSYYASCSVTHITLSIPRVPKGLFQRRHVHLDPPLRAMCVAPPPRELADGRPPGVATARAFARGAAMLHEARRCRLPPGGRRRRRAAWTPGLRRERVRIRMEGCREGGGAPGCGPHCRAMCLGPPRSCPLGVCRVAAAPMRFGPAGLNEVITQED